MNPSKHVPDYFRRIRAAVNTLDHKKLIKLIIFIQSMIGEKSKTLFIAGNGGSAATASHMACDLGKTILGKKPRENNRRLRVICLNDNIPLMTAWGNDEGYEYIFSEQLRNLGTSQDALVIITGSGNSPNILQAIEAAKEIGMETFGILGFDGGKAKKILNDCLIVDSFDYGVVEDIHMITVHLITDWLKGNL